MTLSDYARRFGGYWPPRGGADGTALADPAAPGEDGTARPARTLMAGDEIRHDGAWTPILKAYPDRRPIGAHGELVPVMVLVVDGAEVIRSYKQPVYSRDAEEQARAAAKGGAL